VASTIARSTLADANESRDWRIYADFAQTLIAIARPLYAHDPIGVELNQSLYALDSTTIDLCLSLFPWAFKHRYGLIPRIQESNPMRFVRCRTTSGYEAMILTPEQAYSVLLNLRERERTLMLLASGTGLRISECLGLQWQDVSFADAMIHVRRTWTCGQVGVPKSKASKGCSTSSGSMASAILFPHRGSNRFRITRS